ncbi:MAG: hypothetical protein RBT70_00935 [Alphaproteobacteria bacterium]|jgi:hypothetical protein|nr:hypothetical protein [Alphaproteobacteria bacterium]
MSWFPDYQPVENSDLSDASFLAAGRALHICHLFENQCKWVLQTGEVSASLKENKEISFKEAWSNFKDRWLAQTVKSLGQLSGITDNDVATLEEAVAARNYIAHESTLFFHSQVKWLTIATVKKLRFEVQRLSKGTSLTSLWSYEIENREPGPRGIFYEYPKLVDDWCFGHLKFLLEENENHPELNRAEAVLLEYENVKNSKKKKASQS